MIYSWSELCLSRIEVFMIHSRLIPASPDGTRRAHMHTGIAQYALGRSHPPAAAYIPHHIHIHRAVPVAGAALGAGLTGGCFLDDGIPCGQLHHKRYRTGYLAEGPLLSEDKSQRDGGGIIKPVSDEEEQQLMVFMLGNETAGGVVNMLRDVVVAGLDHDEGHDERDDEDRVADQMIFRWNGLVLLDRQPLQQGSRPACPAAKAAAEDERTADLCNRIMDQHPRKNPAGDEIGEVKDRLLQLKILPLHQPEKKEEHRRHEQNGDLAAGLLFPPFISAGCVNSYGNTGPDPCKEQKARPSEHQDGGKGAEENKWDEFLHGSIMRLNDRMPPWENKGYISTHVQGRSISVPSMLRDSMSPLCAFSFPGFFSVRIKNVTMNRTVR